MSHNSFAIVTKHTSSCFKVIPYIAFISTTPTVKENTKRFISDQFCEGVIKIPSLMLPYVDWKMFKSLMHIMMNS